MQLVPHQHDDEVEAYPFLKVVKGWGYEVWIVNEESCVKLLHFQAGKRDSWHFHNRKEEVFYVQSGRFVLRYSHGNNRAAAASVLLLPGMSFVVPAGLRHQLEAEEESEMLIFSTQHEEEDSIEEDKISIAKGD